jgi:hypothetical protein
MMAGKGSEWNGVFEGKKKGRKEESAQAKHRSKSVEYTRPPFGSAGADDDRGHPYTE